VLTRGLITLAVSTVSIDLPQYTNSIFLTTVLWVMGDERVSFGILLLAFSRFLCHIQFVTTRSLLALAAYLGSYSASHRACVSAWLMCGCGQHVM